MPPPKYLAQELADTFTEGDFHIKIIFLPVAHPELNPIEHVWDSVKRTVASQNFDFNLTKVEELTLKLIDSFTGANAFGGNRLFSKFYSRAIKEEDKCREAQKVADDLEDSDSDCGLAVPCSRV